MSEYDRQMWQAKKEIIRSAVLRAGGNRSRAARALGLNRTYIFKLIRELGVRVPAGSQGRPPRGAGALPRERA